MKMTKKTTEPVSSVDINSAIREAEIASKKKDEDNFWPIDYLPSRYKLYPNDTKIYARPLNIREVKQLSTINESNVDFIINEVVRKATYGVEVEDLLVQDKLFIIFWLRENTYRDAGFTIDSECPHCNFKNTYEFDINKLDVKEISEDANEDLELILKKSGDSIKVKYLRVRDENRVATFKHKNRNSLTTFDDEFLNIANLIKEINGTPCNSLLNTYSYVDSLHPVDFSYLLSYISSINFGVTPILNTTCNSCGGDAPIGVSFQPDFFIPIYKFE